MFVDDVGGNAELVLLKFLNDKLAVDQVVERGGADLPDFFDQLHALHTAVAKRFFPNADQFPHLRKSDHLGLRRTRALHHGGDAIEHGFLGGGGVEDRECQQRNRR